jgi:hypothetical protein
MLVIFNFNQILEVIKSSLKLSYFCFQVSLYHKINR